MAPRTPYLAGLSRRRNRVRTPEIYAYVNTHTFTRVYVAAVRPLAYKPVRAKSIHTNSRVHPHVDGDAIALRPHTHACAGADTRKEGARSRACWKHICKENVSGPVWPRDTRAYLVF